MRLTRAALRAEAQSGRDTTDAPNAHADPQDRIPLGEVSPNTTTSTEPEPDEARVEKMTTNKSKAKTGGEQGSVESEAAQAPEAGRQPEGPPRAGRTTRRQLAKQQERSLRSRGSPPVSANDDIKDAIAGVEPESSAHAEAAVCADAATEPAVPHNTLDSVHVDIVAPKLKITLDTEPEPKTLTSERPYEEATSPVASHTPSRASSRSQSKSPMRLEESIEAFDALEEALENVGKAIVFDQSADEASPRKASFPPDATQPAATKKSPLARNISRGSSVASRQSMKPAAPRLSIVRSSSVRATTKERKATGEVSDYLASKRRPISMSFPTPPPPPKSNKAPTKATFQLPGEAVAARLKAQREERLQRETDGGVVKPRPLSMPPPPKSTKALTKANFQLPGEAIAAKLKAQREERLRREAEGEAPVPRQFQQPPRPKASKPPTPVNFQLPGSAVAARLKAQREERLKREEERAATNKTAFKAQPAPVRKPVAATVRQTTASRARENAMSKENAAGVTIPPLPQSTSSSNVGKRGSIILSRTISTSSATSSKRNSMILNPGVVTKSTVTPADAAAQKIKGKQVFNRDKVEKEAKERERREKEEAAKRARAEAAERGRIASREWAEKQRKKMMSNAAAMKTEAA